MADVFSVVRCGGWWSGGAVGGAGSVWVLSQYDTRYRVRGVRNPCSEGTAGTARFEQAWARGLPSCRLARRLTFSGTRAHGEWQAGSWPAVLVLAWMRLVHAGEVHAARRRSTAWWEQRQAWHRHLHVRDASERAVSDGLPAKAMRLDARDVRAAAREQPREAQQAQEQQQKAMQAARRAPRRATTFPPAGYVIGRRVWSRAVCLSVRCVGPRAVLARLNHSVPVPPHAPHTRRRRPPPLSGVRSAVPLGTPHALLVSSSPDRIRKTYTHTTCSHNSVHTHKIHTRSLT